MTTRPFVLLALALAAAGCGGSPRNGDGQVGDLALPAWDFAGGVVVDLGGPGEVDLGGQDLAAPLQGDNLIPANAKVAWSKRPCELTVRYPGKAGKVLLAGEFTNWANGALTLQPQNGQFELTLTPIHGLVAGRLYAYKLIVDNNWLVDESAPYRKFDGNCLNSALLFPDCNRPEIKAEPVQLAPAGLGANLRARALLHTAVDGAPPSGLWATLDRKPVAPAAATLDPATGAVTITVANLPRGKHTLRLRLIDGQNREALPVELPFWVEEQPFDPRDGLLYMVFTDRFADGEPGSNRSAGPGVDYPGDWHGGDLVGALRVMQSGYFEKLGTRTIWLSPVNRQVDGHFKGRGDDPNRYAGYHGYWPIRAREVEPRYGGGAALRAFVDEAHRRGIRVVIDLINNQVHEQHEYLQPHPDWFRRACVCGIDQGCGWSERPFDCLFDLYLPDINWRHADAERQFVDDAVYWLSEYDLDGFRVDAVKHVEPNAVYNLRGVLGQRFEQGGARILMLGETAVGEGDKYDFFCQQFASGYEWIDAYTSPRALDGQFDFPTHHQTQEGVPSGAMGYDVVEGVVKKAEGRYREAGRHVRFFGSQDSARLASVAAQDPKRGCKWAKDCGGALPPSSYGDPALYARLKRTFTLLFTLPGIPFLYNGDELAIPGGNDPDNRRDFVWDDQLVGLQIKGANPPPLTAAQKDLRSFVQGVAQARVQSLALRRGRRIPILATADLYVYAWRGGGPKDLALVVLNRGPAVQGRAVGKLVDRGMVQKLGVVVGSAQASLAGDDLAITIGAGESAILVGQ